MTSSLKKNIVKVVTDGKMLTTKKHGANGCQVGEIVSSELPPMWVPLAVGVVLAVGISLLQGSLGDVMNDEAKLGALSGARAAKQSARDRDMFKKKDPK